MRFAIGLSCLVLAISIFSQAQSKALHQTKSEIMSVTLSHDDWGVEDAACDSKGNTFATLWKSEVDDGPADRPLLMFDHAGVLKARFSSSSKDDPRLFIHEPTALMSDGSVARLTWSRWSREPPWLTVFSSDGKLKSRVQLDPPGFFPSQLAVFPSGESLVSGLEHVHSSRAVGPYKSFTAIYDKNGHLQKRLSLPVIANYLMRGHWADV